MKKWKKKELNVLNGEVQITDCRYRPLDATFDNYSSYKTNRAD